MLIALPAMLKRAYAAPVATGIICASGTLGQIIPPSIVLILLADAVSNAASQAANEMNVGSFVVSVGDRYAVIESHQPIPEWQGTHSTVRSAPPTRSAAPHGVRPIAAARVLLHERYHGKRLRNYYSFI